MIENEFFLKKITKSNVDRFITRTSILKAIENVLPLLKGYLLDVGCGKMPYKKFIVENSDVNKYTGLDIEDAIVYDSSVTPDFTWDGETMPFSDNTFDCGIATEVLEHCPDPNLILSEVNRVLKPGGLFFFTVPFLWPLHEVPNDEFRYTPFALQKFLKNNGFTRIDIKSLGGWHASMAQMLGLWLKRSHLNKWLRRILVFMALPLIKVLLKHDKKPEEFTESTMISGLTGIAYKKN